MPELVFLAGLYQSILHRLNGGTSRSGLNEMRQFWPKGCLASRDWSAEEAAWCCRSGTSRHRPSLPSLSVERTNDTQACAYLSQVPPSEARFASGASQPRSPGPQKRGTWYKLGHRPGHKHYLAASSQPPGPA
ncbi:hypothetical protein PGTUg99_021690 [Puccinia graminis f. sp. tritici]|uniref:Uncharacterized protein n=1 Tax=Puccinia graminis f. sp. tritici TaxID=56615 RepID=A0A5B0N0U4_PUCGR|nr:hypothetical protein PGTUg99_021690 [Puccinia graminis f. sp. tritici]